MTKGVIKFDVVDFSERRSEEVIQVSVDAQCILMSHSGKQYTGAPGDFAPEMQKRALENQKEPLKIHHRLPCKSLNIQCCRFSQWDVSPRK